MNLVTKNFCIYLNNAYNFKDILSYWNKSFGFVYDQISEGKYVSHDFKFEVKKYPKYPQFFRYITKINNYNVIKIQNATAQSLHRLSDIINDDIIFLKTKIDGYPNKDFNFIFDINLQNTFFTPISELYNNKHYLLNNCKLPKYQSILYHIIGKPFYDNSDWSKGILSCSFIQQFSSLYYISRMIPSITNFKSLFIRQFVDNERIQPKKIRDEFNYFLNNYYIGDLYSERHKKEEYEKSIRTRSNFPIFSEKNHQIYSIEKDVEISGPDIEKYITAEGVTVDLVYSFLDEKNIDMYNNDVIITNARTNKKVISDQVADIILTNVYMSSRTSNELKNSFSDAIRNDILTLPTKFEKFIIDSGKQPSLDIANIFSRFFYQFVSVYILLHFSNKNNVMIKNDPDNLQMDRETLIISNFLNRVNQFNLEKYITLSYLYKNNPIKYLSSLSLILSEFIQRDIMTIDEKYFNKSDVANIINTMETKNYFEGMYFTLLDKLKTEELYKYWKFHHGTQFVICIYFLDLIDQFIESTYFMDFISNILKSSSNFLMKFGYIDENYNWFRCVEGLRLYFKTLFRKKILSGELFGIFSQTIENDLNAISPGIEYFFDMDGIKEHFNEFRDDELVLENIHNFVGNMYLSTIIKQIYYDILSYFGK